jgi:hypothetical protein
MGLHDSHSTGIQGWLCYYDHHGRILRIPGEVIIVIFSG